MQRDPKQVTNETPVEFPHRFSFNNNSLIVILDLVQLLHFSNNFFVFEAGMVKCFTKMSPSVTVIVHTD